MSRIRKLLGLNQGGYDRPNQPWVCGHACGGHGCQMGPDKHGHCQAGGECLPRRQGDRWHCTRSAELGGPCANGPLPNGGCSCVIPPCQPVRTLRAKRGLFCWAAVGVTLGALLFALGGRNPDRWLNPGPLTSVHATSEARCSDCHSIAETSAKSGMGRIIANHPVASSNCLQCHELGSQPLLPHGLTEKQLSEASGRREGQNSVGTPLLVSLARSLHTPALGIECTACHTEHQGRMADIRSIDDRQCQVCHESTFKGFPDGHPEFGDYPYARRTRIIFDHASHLQKHFQEPASQSKAPASCLDCHVPGDAKGKMLVKGFEQSCASCHASQIEGEGRAGAKGIAFFRVPGLDAAGLRDAGYSVGQWPEFAEGPINPFLRLLLSADHEAAADFKTLEKVDLTDIADARKEQQAAAFRTAWRIKSLFFDLTSKGQPALMERLAMISGGTKPESGPLVSQLSADTLLAAKAAWWPDLFTEVPLYRQGVLPPLPAKSEPASKPAVSTPAKSAASQDDILGGDDLTAVASTQTATQKPATDDILGDDILSPAPVAKPVVKKPAQDDILGDDILATAPAPKPPAAAAKPSDSLEDILGSDDSAPSKTATSAATKTPPKVEVADQESWVAAGGWYRSDDTYTLYYRPTGHADAFIKAWVEAGSRMGGLMPAELVDPKAPGMCAKCHSVDPVHPAEGRIAMNWLSAKIDSKRHDSTKFNHTAHFSLLTEKGCQTCHVLAPEADYQSSYAVGATVHHSNFRALAKETCAACHQNEVAGNSCQLCHNYHQGVFDEGKIRHPGGSSAKVLPAR